MVTPVAIESIAWKTYVVWACTNLTFIPITYFFYVETTGQTLEDIDLIVSVPYNISLPFIGTNTPSSSRVKRVYSLVLPPRSVHKRL